jgi:hypothetical protein
MPLPKKYAHNNMGLHKTHRHATFWMNEITLNIKTATYHFGGNLLPILQ